MKWLRGSLQIVGACSLLFLVFAAIVLGWDFHISTTDRFNEATRKDVLFILNWGGIPTDQDLRIIESYQSGRDLRGGHSDSYCLDLPKFEVASIQQDEWHDGPEENPILAEALELAINDAQSHLHCFPSLGTANSKAMKLKFVSVTLHDRFATAADIILYDAESHRLYFVSYRT